MQALLCCLALAAVSDEKFLSWVAAKVDVATLPATSGQRLSAAELASLAGDKPTLPFADLTVAVRVKDGGLWAGSHRGLMYLAPGAARWRLFHSRRWLENDDVQDLAVTGQGEVGKYPGVKGKLEAALAVLKGDWQALGMLPRDGW